MLYFCVFRMLFLVVCVCCVLLFYLFVFFFVFMIYIYIERLCKYISLSVVYICTQKNNKKKK